MLVVCWSWLCVGFCCCVAWFGVFGTWSLCSSHKGLAHTAPKAQYHNYVKCRGDVCTTTVRMGQITSHGRSRSTMLQLAYGFPDALKTGLEKAIHSVAVLGIWLKASYPCLDLSTCYLRSPDCLQAMTDASNAFMDSTALLSVLCLQLMPTFYNFHRQRQSCGQH